MNARSAKLLPVVVSVAVACQSDGGPGDFADVIFTNADIYTVNDAQPTAEAVAVRGNEIVYVGDAAGAGDLEGPDTEVIDLEGRMVLPGFVSGHDHLIASNWTKAGVNLFEGASKEDYLRIIRKYADANPDVPIVIGYGWEPNAYGAQPTAADLDQAVPDRPAIMFDYTIHDLWFNTAGLEAAGVDASTADPQPGFSYWARDDRGNPTGLAVEVSWMRAYIDMGAWQPETMIPESQAVLYDAASKAGLTAVAVPGLITPNLTNLAAALADMRTAMELLREMDAAGTLDLRTFAFQIYKDPNGDVSELIEGTRALMAEFDTDRLRLQGIKIHPEGNWNTQTSLMLEPYTDGTLGNAGIRGELAVAKLGMERVRAEYAMYPDAVRRGLHVSLASDIPSAPVPLLGPLVNIEAAMTMQSPPDEDSEPFPPGREGLTLEQAIRAVTIWPAWQLYMEDKIGSIEVGKYADLVVLERNLFDVAPRDIADVGVLATMMDGRFTHRDGF